MKSKNFFCSPRINLTNLIIFAAVVAAIPVVAQEATTSTPQLKEKALATSATSEAEVIRRQELVIRAQILIRDAESEMANGNFSSAIPKYEEAARVLPEGPATAGEQSRIATGLSAANFRLGQQAYENGQYGEARNYLSRSVAADGGNKQAQSLLKKVEEVYQEDTKAKAEQAARTPAVVSDPDFKRKQDKALELFYLAEDYVKSGQYDEGEQALKEVLKIDPYSATAYHRLREVQKLKVNKYQAMRLQLEAQAELQVTERWLTYQRPPKSETEAQAQPMLEDEKGRQNIMRKLRDIRIKRIEFENATIDAAVKFLAEESRRADTGPDPKGVDIVLRTVSAQGGGAAPAPAPEPGGAVPAPEPAAGGKRINLILNDVELGRALTFLTSVADLKYLVTEGAVVIYDGISPQSTVIKTFSVAPGVFRGVGDEETAAPESGQRGSGGFIGFEPAEMKKAKMDVKPVFESFGIEFPPGTSISYNEGLGLLVVRHTPDVIDQIETILLKLNRTPRQVTIEARFLDIRQEMLKELGFQWYMKGFTGSDNNTQFSSGANSGVANSGTFPVEPIPGTFDWPVDQLGSQRSAQNDLTAGLLDTLIAGTSGTTPISALFTIANIVGDLNWGVIINAIDRKGGANLLQAPRVTTLSGEQAQILVTREFIYPSAYTDPQVVAGTGTTGGGASAAFVGPSPSEFTTREVGVVLNVRPTVGDDEYTVSMTLTPEVVDFEGFLIYTGTAQLSGGAPVTFSISQPLFSKRTVSTSVVVWDGQTVVLGGLISEDEKKFDDRIPILGDLPLVGRLFQSKGDTDNKRNLMIFVTPTIVDPSGNPIRSRDAAIKLPSSSRDLVLDKS
jgi:general secretion pathway protein D